MIGISGRSGDRNQGIYGLSSASEPVHMPPDAEASPSVEACFDNLPRQFLSAREHHFVAAIHLD